MAASFWLTNRSPYRSELRHLLHRVEMPIFVIFFTLIGQALDLSVLGTLLPITLVLFAVRLLALFVGGYIGGSLAGDPARFNRLDLDGLYHPGWRRLGIGEGSRD